MLTTTNIIRFTFPERIVLERLFDDLKRYEEGIDEDFKRKTGRWPQPSDKIWKIVEELGEVKDSTSRKEQLDEIWDSSIACIGLALLLQYPSDQIIDGLERLLQKLDDRWGPEGTGRPERKEVSP